MITVYAVKEAHLPLDANAAGALVGFTLNFNALATAHVTGRYGRPK